MNFSFSTLGCPNASLDQIIDYCNKYNIKGIEVRGINGIMENHLIPEFFPKNQEETLDKLSKNSLEIIGLGTSVRFHDKDNFNNAIIEGKKAIDICQQMKIPNIRVFGDKIEILSKRENTITEVINGLIVLCTYNTNIDVLLEIHGDFNTIENITPILENMKKYKNFGILWDIQHSDKIYKDNWQDFYYVIKPYIKRVHIKDYIRQTKSADFKLTTIGNGQIPIKQIVTQLLEDEYLGYFSLEWEKKWHEDLPDISVALDSFVAVMSSFE